ncbi:hypothetical protein BDV95DRAFT_603575 [Massariosphaeria phaeospora]|uniref:Uncharacterized protein n=1 Tax=Massariosphaeria phaeospora TaxID=100035 RepID=A0A7C8MJG4_9PLEO|nr:hypothetical protein BDV95DRAFT_603575 [Massariosphaeria phaeospora]
MLWKRFTKLRARAEETEKNAKDHPLRYEGPVLRVLFAGPGTEEIEEWIEAKRSPIAILEILPPLLKDDRYINWRENFYNRAEFLILWEGEIPRPEYVNAPSSTREILAQQVQLLKRKNYQDSAVGWRTAVLHAFYNEDDGMDRSNSPNHVLLSLKRQLEIYIRQDDTLGRIESAPEATAIEHFKRLFNMIPTNRKVFVIIHDTRYVETSNAFTALCNLTRDILKREEKRTEPIHSEIADFVQETTEKHSLNYNFKSLLHEGKLKIKKTLGEKGVPGPNLRVLIAGPVAGSYPTLLTRAESKEYVHKI